MLGKEKILFTGSGRYHVGIDAGSVSVNCIVVNESKEIVYEAPYERHFGKVDERVLALIEDLYQRFGEENVGTLSFTGNHGKSLSERLHVFYEFDTISQVLGATFVTPGVRTIISMGGQDTALFQIAYDSSGETSGRDAWTLEYFNTNGPCASGTGSFIDQQAERLATSIYGGKTDVSQDRIDNILSDFIRLGTESEKPANVACRCTVFTKSDMIHLQNRGETLQDIIYGLHVGNARNYMSTIVSNREVEAPIVFVGGLSLNELQVKAFREYFPEMMIPPYNRSAGALGVALEALENACNGGRATGKKCEIDLEELRGFGSERSIKVPTAEKLLIRETVFPETNEIGTGSLKKKTGVYFGIDIGSTTTKYAVINEKREIIHKNYVPTKGKPIEVVQELLGSLHQQIGKKIEILGAAATGSGRNVVGDFLNVDLVIDEITAHAKGAVEIDPRVDTIFEIGGQDSKYISISNTYPLDFDMNKVCAAGTGSFLHELANKYGINIVEEFQEIALSSDAPVKLAERCTVFMESDLVSYHQKGANRNDLIAGLCYAIVYNYLNRVVEKRKIGQRVMFLGGPSLNKGVVAAFENVLGRGLSVPKHREVLGAYGAAISVQEKMGFEKKESTFRGFKSAVKDRMEFTEKTCRADRNCHNQCKLKIYDFDGRRSVWGGECGRYELSRRKGGKKEDLFAFRHEVWQKHIAGVYEELQGEPILKVGNRPTVGMQRALYGIQTSVLWAHFFDRLGFRLVLTPATNARISRAGIETMTSETCYPVKVSHGHVAELVGKTAHLFIPTMITMKTPRPEETGFFCPLVQSNSYMVRMAVDLSSESVLNPVVHLKYNLDSLTLEIADQIKDKLGVRRAAIRNALEYALERQDQFAEELLQKGREILENHNTHEPLVVVTGRPYNLYDERLNLRLGQNLSKIGVSALPMDFVDLAPVDLSDFPSMYWGLGAQVLRTAKFVSERSWCFGLHLTNFGCGADSFLEHFYRHIMGEKPYLILELDEHSAVAGAMTRLEAYQNVIENSLWKSVEGRNGDPGMGK